MAQGGGHCAHGGGTDRHARGMVSAPGKGPAARDKTAVSEVSLEGYAG